MEGQQKQLIIAAVLGVVLVIVFITQLGPLLGGSSAPPASQAAPAVSASGTDLASLLRQPERHESAPATPYAELVAVLDVRELDFTQAEVRNPFRALVGPGSLAREQAILDDARRIAGFTMDDDMDSGLDLDLGYALSGIVWNDGEPVCLLNDQVLAVGDEIEEGGIITAITEEAVVFTYEGTSLTLTFLPEA